MEVWIKKPLGSFSPVDIDNTLEALQKAVGGYIETVSIKDEPDREEWAVIICNEEGRLLDMFENITIGGWDFYGPIVICGQDGEEFADAPEWIREACVGFNRRHGFPLANMNQGELFIDAMSGEPV